MRPQSRTYFFLPRGDLLEEVRVDGVDLRQVGLTLEREEVVDVLLRLHLLHHVVDVDSLDLLLWIHRGGVA